MTFAKWVVFFSKHKLNDKKKKERPSCELPTQCSSLIDNGAMEINM